MPFHLFRITFFSFWSVLKFSFPSGSDRKEPACNTGDLGSIRRLTRFPGEGNGDPLHSCLENSVDKGAWRAIVRRVAKSWTRLSDYHFHIKFAVSYYHHSWIFSLSLFFLLNELIFQLVIVYIHEVL